MQLPGIIRAMLPSNDVRPDSVRSDSIRPDSVRPDSQSSATGGGHNISEHLPLLMLIDAILLLLVLWGAAIVVPSFYDGRADANRISPYWSWVPLLVGGWWLAATLHDLYDLSALHRRTYTAVRVVLASLTVAAALFFVALVLPTSLGFELTIAYLLVVAIPLLILSRRAYTSVSTMPRFSRRTLIVGRGERAQRALELVKQHSFLNYQVLGYISDVPDASEIALDGLPVWNNPQQLFQWVHQVQIHEIVIATEAHLDRQLFTSLLECQANGVQVVWLPDLYERFRYNVPVDQVDPQWVLQAVRSEPNILQRMAKRFLDLAVVAFALPVLLVFIPLVALAIKLDSPGPVFYRQVRCGRASKLFRIYKFRTMYIDAERDGKARWATKDDPRITRVGRWLRKTRLDELPQVLNVLQGTMSIVGPRPERPEFVEELKSAIPYYHTRLLVKPGLTGWAQIQFNYTSTVEDTVTKLQYDLYYIHRWTLWLDIYIMFRTIGVVLGLKGT